MKMKLTYYYVMNNLPISWNKIVNAADKWMPNAITANEFHLHY